MAERNQLQPSINMSNKRAILTVVALLAVINITLGIKWFIASRATPSAAPCINNLRQIESAKEQWKLEQQKTVNDVPTWEDLKSYFKQQPVCPEGGTYAWGKVGELPKCSIGGVGHSTK